MLLNYLFLSFLLLVLLLEGIGIPNGREISYFLILFLSPIFLIYILFFKKKFIFPWKTGILFMIFIVSSIVSSLFGINIENSLHYSFYLISVFFVFLFAYNSKSSLKIPLIRLIFIVSFLFVIYYLLLHFYNPSYLRPTTGYQFVFSRIGSHNHIGDFLVLSTIICVYSL